MSDIYAALKDQITTANQIQVLLADAARTERFIAKPKHPGSPAMYDLITVSHTAEEMQYQKTELKLRATPRQVSRWEFAIEVLRLIDSKISKDPILDRQLFWLRANRLKWSSLARQFLMNRSTLKSRYEKVLYQLVDRVRIEIKFDKLNKILYLI
jgi:hypothetical protein